MAVSGGADSLMALVLLREAGCRVLAVHGLFTAEARPGGPEGLAGVCARLGAEFHVLDLRAEFEDRVVAPFVRDYAAGRTPNPCAVCNAAVKFGLFLDRVAGLGATHLATGHYAGLLDLPGLGRVLVRGADETRDQSYFLSLVPRERLERSVFPLGGMRKDEVRRGLAARGLTPPLTAESREVCFVPGDDYRRFLEGRGADLSGPGPAVFRDGREAGRHRGLWRYTLGQRRGLGIAWREPLYVLDKDVAGNRLVVGTAAELAADGCEAGEANILVPAEAWPGEVLVQTRYRQKALPGRVERTGAGLRFFFREAQARPTPGQVAAAYAPDGMVLAAGVITRSTTVENVLLPVITGKHES